MLCQFDVYFVTKLTVYCLLSTVDIDMIDCLLLLSLLLLLIARRPGPGNLVIVIVVKTEVVKTELNRN
jgi:hypothetical protein